MKAWVTGLGLARTAEGARGVPEEARRVPEEAGPRPVAAAEKGFQHALWYCMRQIHALYIWGNITYTVISYL